MIPEGLDNSIAWNTSKYNAQGGVSLGTGAPLKTSTKPQEGPTSSEGTPGSVFETFGQLFKEHVHAVNQSQTFADQAMTSYAVGDPIPLHEVITKAEKAQLSLEFTMQLRNKMVQAYQEMMRMNI